MNLSSSLRALAFASVSALPLSAGVLTINFTETGGNVVVTASGSITDSSAWSPLYVGGPVPRLIDPVNGFIWFGGSGIVYGATGSNTGSWAGDFGTGILMAPSSFSGGPLSFSSIGELLLSSTYVIGPSAPSLTGTMTFAGNFTSLGITPVAKSAVFGGDTIQLTFGSGGGSSVPDAGPGPALALLLGGLGLRQWRSSRRARAAA